MVKCESVTDGYTKYVHFVHPLDIRDGSWTWKMPSSREVDSRLPKRNVQYSQ